MNMENKQPSSIDQVASVDKARRKLTKAGIASPIMLSLASKPVWAEICTCSGMMSGNVSNPTFEANCSQPGLSMEFWLNNPDCWPAPFNISPIFDIYFTDDSTGPMFEGKEFPEILEAAIKKGSLKTAPEVNCTEDTPTPKPQNTLPLRRDLRDVAGACIAGVLNSQAGFPNYPYNGDYIISELKQAYVADRSAGRGLGGAGGSCIYLCEDLLALNNPYQ